MKKLIYILLVPRGEQYLKIYSFEPIYDTMMATINQLHNIEKDKYIRYAYFLEELKEFAYGIYEKMENESNNEKFYVELSTLNNEGKSIKILEGEW